MYSQAAVSSITFRKSLGFILFLIASAWLVLWFDHDHHLIPFQATSLQPVYTADHSLLTTFFGWELMLIAMMLPTAIPIFSLFSRMIESRPHRTTLQLLLLLGYLTPWSLSGIFFIILCASLRSTDSSFSGIHTIAWAFGPTILITAGLYQFSSLKNACLKQCRSKIGMLMQYWQGGHERRQAYRLGVGHGLFCLGCCWLLMLTMGITGLHHIGWMVLMGTVMALEKNLAAGHVIRKPLGMGLIMWGLILLVNEMPDGSF